MTPIGEIIRAVMLKLALPAELRDLERKIMSLEHFDRDVSGRIDQIRALLEE